MCYLVIYYQNGSYAYITCASMAQAEAARERIRTRPRVKKVEIATQMRIYI